jgi:hypothetical protein
MKSIDLLDWFSTESNEYLQCHVESTDSLKVGQQFRGITT